MWINHRKAALDEQQDLIQKLENCVRSGEIVLQESYSSISKQIDRS